MNLFEKMLFLKSTALFEPVKEDALLDVSASLEEQIVKKGEPIIHKGELGTTMYLIVNGRVKVHDGDQVFKELGDHEVFGELAVLSPEKRNASVTALEETLLLKISHALIFDLMEMHVELAKGVIQVLCQRIRTISSDLSQAISH